MLIEHRDKVPEVDPSAYVAPTAVICGAVRIGPLARVLFPGTVYGVSRDTPAKERMTRQAEWFAAHLDDRLL